MQKKEQYQKFLPRRDPGDPPLNDEDRAPVKTISFVFVTI